ncbi:energy transducer TonB [Bradyrhizobium sp.]|uniref:energy transducer TonB n=1 Tax=Bradyrhizobium sp. TaxID=376 RepID=UPI003C5D250C
MSDGDAEQGVSRRLWILAALAALALHLGGAALAFTHLRAADDDDGLGANGIEVALDMESPKAPDNDLPPGPDADAAQASAPVAEQKAEVKQTELPKDRPTETEDPDRVVTLNDSNKPKQDDPKIAAVETPASEERSAQEATAMQTLDDKAPEAAKAKAPNVGIGKDKQKLTAKWGRRITAYFELHKRYPENKDKTTTVKVSLVLDRRGKVMSVAVKDSSGDPVFDEAAVAMIHRSDPVPPPPAGLTDDQFAFTLDVNFKKPK